VLNASGSTVSIYLTQTYLYTHTVVKRNDSMIAGQSTPLTHSGDLLVLNCALSCNQSSGYIPIPIKSFCKDYSKALDITGGQRSNIINLTNNSYFLIVFQSE